MKTRHFHILFTPFRGLFRSLIINWEYSNDDITVISISILIMPLSNISRTRISGICTMQLIRKYRECEIFQHFYYHPIFIGQSNLSYFSDRLWLWILHEITSVRLNATWFAASRHSLQLGESRSINWPIDRANARAAIRGEILYFLHNDTSRAVQLAAAKKSGKLWKFRSDYYNVKRYISIYRKCIFPDQKWAIETIGNKELDQ